jgi:hypothetical protein
MYLNELTNMFEQRGVFRLLPEAELSERPYHVLKTHLILGGTS